MPRTQLHRRVASLLGILVLAGGLMGPLAAPATAAPQHQDGSGSTIVVSIDEPTNRSGTSATRLLVRGWAVDPNSQRGTGVSRVDLYLDAGPDQGGQYLGRAEYGRGRSDVADALGGGNRFLNSGWDIVVDLPRGPHTLIAIAAPPGATDSTVIPGVASVHAVVGGRAGRTPAVCAAGGYCTGMEGGLGSGPTPGFREDPIYPGNLYVGYGPWGHGENQPPYGWWDANLPAIIPLLIQSAAFNNAPYFYGHVPRLYDQPLLTTLSTNGILATGGSCSGPAFGGLGILGLSQLGGYIFGTSFGPTSTLGGGGLGSFGLPNSTYGTAGSYALGTPLSTPFGGSFGLGQLVASGNTGAWNGSVSTISGTFGGRFSGVGGAGGVQTGSFGYGPGDIGPGGFPVQCASRL